MNRKKDFYNLRYDDKIVWLIEETNKISSEIKELRVKLNEVGFLDGYGYTPWHLLSEKQKELYFAFMDMLNS